MMHCLHKFAITFGHKKQVTVYTGKLYKIYEIQVADWDLNDEIVKMYFSLFSCFQDGRNKRAR
jgi:hypothetical protein